MNINNINNIARIYGEQNKVNKTSRSDKPAAAGQKDEVVLSPEAQEFQQVLQSIRNTPGVREDKVKEFSARIDAGTYKVDARAIADKMLSGLSDRSR